MSSYSGGLQMTPRAHFRCLAVFALLAVSFSNARCSGSTSLCSSPPVPDSMLVQKSARLVSPRDSTIAEPATDRVEGWEDQQWQTTAERQLSMNTSRGSQNVSVVDSGYAAGLGLSKMVTLIQAAATSPKISSFHLILVLVSVGAVGIFFMVAVCMRQDLTRAPQRRMSRPQLPQDAVQRYWPAPLARNLNSSPNSRSSPTRKNGCLSLNRLWNTHFMVSSPACSPASLNSCSSPARKRKSVCAFDACTFVKSRESTVAMSSTDARMPNNAMTSSVVTGDESPCLCPACVVPDDLVLELAIPVVLHKVPQNISFSIVCLQGRPMVNVMVNETGRDCVIQLLSVLQDNEPLALLRTTLVHQSGQSTVEICWPSHEVFGSVTKMDHPKRSYVLRSSPSGQLLWTFNGDFREKAITVLDTSNRVVSETMRYTTEFDSSPHYKVLVASDIDAGMVLCGLLAIDKMEGSSCALQRDGGRKHTKQLVEELCIAT